jgi:aromatic-L-amino-acid decarboxylase
MTSLSASGPDPTHFDPAEFKREAASFIDWIGRYLSDVEHFPVRAQTSPGELHAALPDHPPLEPEPVSAIIADLDRLIVPGLTHWQSPSFFAYFPANTSIPSLMGELVSAAMGVQGMLWVTSPACTELETRMLDWLRVACALPTRFSAEGPGGAVLQDSASSAVLCALLAARERASEGRASEEGDDGRGVVYGSTQTHSSLEKALMVAGIGRRRLRKLAVDASYALDPTALRAALAADRAQGFSPTMVCATVGTTSTLAIDPLPEIGRICAGEGVWLHVDAALAGSAAVCPEYQGLLAGLEYADSYCFNPHKWLLTHFDCSALYVADRRWLVNALSITPEYLRNTASDSGAVIDYRDWQIPLGRRFRALKLWFVMRRFGLEGLRRHIRQQVAMASRFAALVAGDPAFEMVATPRLNLVCFRACGSDDLNRRLLERVNDGGHLYLSHTLLDGRFVLRLSTGQPRTAETHIDAAWRHLQDARARLADA